MKILITNDDGIFADGLYDLYQALKEDFEVTVVAPLREQSSQSHSLTLNEPLTYREVNRDGGFFGYGVEGTPADAAKFGIKVIFEEKPDLIVSGINRGANVGTSLLYSGTIAAAYEGLIEDIPSVAISLDGYQDVDFSYSADFAKVFLEYLVKKDKLYSNLIYNINIPSVPEDDIEGVKVTFLSEAKYQDFYEQRVNPRGMEYYWIHGVMSTDDSDSLGDFTALKDNYISVTPLQFNFCSEKTRKRVAEWNLDKLTL